MARAAWAASMAVRIFVRCSERIGTAAAIASVKANCQRPASARTAAIVAWSIEHVTTAQEPLTPAPFWQCHGGQSAGLLSPVNHSLSSPWLMFTKWQSTALFQILSARSGQGLNDGASHVLHKLHLVMPGIEALLAKGGTAPTDFTLHDDDHGRRVAERIADIAGEVLSQLSSAELALLLLAAYLHDVGMTPARDVINRHRQYLLFGAKAPLSEPDRECLQTWLDENADGVVPPLLSDASDVEATNRADWLLTHYSRSRHNDWSEQWSRENLVSPDRQLYPGYLDDLVRLCRSHHESYEQLIEPRFDPRPVQYVGATNIVHLRYLAALLRVADILEFDPERTPEIVFRHRSVSPASTIYWYKDHDVVFTRMGDVMTFSARPASAAVLRAVELMADDVDRELDVCWRLDREGRFSFAPISPQRGPRAWTLGQRLKRDIRPRDDGFEVFEGRFRPKTRRLLELLSGTQLYGTDLAAVRELVQNAFDAVRQRIAYQRLLAIESGLPDQHESLAAQHRVALTIRSDSGGWVLECRDTGMGMTRQILHARFLSPGSKPGHRERELERRARVLGFSVGRTGQFGIGAVSYFMIAAAMQIVTRRSQEAGDDEAVAWQFETRDLDDFGELRRVSTSHIGTTITLKLKSEIGADVRDWLSKLCKYLRKNIVRVPCVFSLQFENEVPIIAWDAGWTLSSDLLREEIISDLAPHMTRGGEPRVERLSSLRKKEIDDEHGVVEAVRAELRATLGLFTEEGELPDRVGLYRIHIPYFRLRPGTSVVYFRVREKDGRTYFESVLKHSYLRPRRTRLMSWNGVAVMHRSFLSRFDTTQQQVAPFLEIDWSSSEVAELAVSRDTVRLGSRAQAAIEFVFERVAKLSAKWVAENSTSELVAMNSRALHVATPPEAPQYWTFWSPSDRAYELRQVTFPLVDLGQLGEAPSVPMLWNGAELKGLWPFAHRPASMTSDLINWSYLYNAPTRLIAWAYEQCGYSPFVLGLWEENGKASYYTKFPDSWRDVAAVTVHAVKSSGVMEVWSDDHPVAMTVSTEAWQWCKQHVRPYGDPAGHHAHILKDPSYAASWLMYVSTHHAREMWNGLAEREPAFVRNVWSLAFGGDEHADRPIIAMRIAGRLEVNVITPAKWEEIELPGGDAARVLSLLPEPGHEWTVGFRTEDLKRADDDAEGD